MSHEDRAPLPSRSPPADPRGPAHAGALEALDAVLHGVDGGSLTTPEAIEQLLSAQTQLRNRRSLQAAMRSSRLPVIKQLHDFDFTCQPSLRREQIESLHERGFSEPRRRRDRVPADHSDRRHALLQLMTRRYEHASTVEYGL